MSDDFVLNVRQIGNYQTLTNLVTAQDLILVQQGGIGGPYKSITQDGLLGQVFQRLNVGILPAPDNVGIAANAVTTPLGQRQGFNWYIDEDGITRYLQNGPAGYWSMVNTAGDLVWATAPPGEKDDQLLPTAWTPIFDLTIDGHLTVGGIAINSPPSAPTDAATVAWVQANTVASFNTRIGAVTLTLADITNAGGAPLASPALTGNPTAPTPATTDSDTSIATTAFVHAAVTAGIGSTVMVNSFNSRTGAVTLNLADVTAVGGAPLASPAFTGTPTAPTPLAGDATNNIATTAFVAASGFASMTYVNSTFAPITSPTFAGTPSAPTPAPGDNTGTLATTAFVHAAVVASTTGVSSFNTRTGAVVLASGDITAAGGALINSPAFTGTPTAPTPTTGTNNTEVATTAFVLAEVAAATAGVSSFNTRTGAVTLSLADVTAVGGAPVASPAFSGVPTAPTATAGTNTGQIASTAFVQGALANTVVSFNGRVGAVSLTSADISAAGGAPLASPAFTGVPTGPTAAPGTNTTELATTAFVQAAIIAIGSDVTSFNGRTGAVVLTTSDITGAGGAPINSPALTGAPTSVTPGAGNNSTAIATTAFVAGAIANAVVSFNGRTGAVSMLAADVTGVGGALLASPAFTGSPTAPTQVAGTNNTTLATTAFVAAALSSGGGVTSFNGRAGIVTLTAGDVTGVGGALLASPTFTGTPSGPTAAPGTNSTQLSTTAFVTAAIAAAVISFNGRTGAVTLTTADITGAGGAVLASPAFTGTPTAPTATAGTNTTQLATTAFVLANPPASYPSSKVTGSAADFSASITLVAADNGCIKNCSAASAVTVTCPTGLVKDFYCTVIQGGAGQITFAAGSGATVNNRQGLLHSAGQYAVCSLIVNVANTYVLGGDCA